MGQSASLGKPAGASTAIEALKNELQMKINQVKQKNGDGAIKKLYEDIEALKNQIALLEKGGSENPTSTIFKNPFHASGPPEKRQVMPEMNHEDMRSRGSVNRDSGIRPEVGASGNYKGGGRSRKKKRKRRKSVRR